MHTTAGMCVRSLANIARTTTSPTSSQLLITVDVVVCGDFFWNTTKKNRLNVWTYVNRVHDSILSTAVVLLGQITRRSDVILWVYQNHIVTCDCNATKRKTQHGSAFSAWWYAINPAHKNNRIVRTVRRMCATLWEHKANCMWRSATYMLFDPTRVHSDEHGTNLTLLLRVRLVPGGSCVWCVSVCVRAGFSPPVGMQQECYRCLYICIVCSQRIRSVGSCSTRNHVSWWFCNHRAKSQCSRTTRIEAVFHGVIQFGIHTNE